MLPLREGGSLPAIVEADDGGCYLVKFCGAGQGALALVAEVVVGEIARALGLRVPEIVLMELDEAFGRSEPDPEIRHLLRASVGLNAGLKYLPSSMTFDPAAGDAPSALDASLIVWLDAFCAECGPDAAQSESAHVAAADVLHRPWCGAVFPPW